MPSIFWIISKCLATVCRVALTSYKLYHTEGSQKRTSSQQQWPEHGLHKMDTGRGSDLLPFASACHLSGPKSAAPPYHKIEDSIKTAMEEITLQSMIDEFHTLVTETN